MNVSGSKAGKCTVFKITLPWSQNGPSVITSWNCNVPKLHELLSVSPTHHVTTQSYSQSNSDNEPIRKPLELMSLILSMEAPPHESLRPQFQRVSQWPGRDVHPLSVAESKVPKDV